MNSLVSCIAFAAVYAGTVRRIKPLHGIIAPTESEIDEDSAKATTTPEEDDDLHTASSFDLNNDTSIGPAALLENTSKPTALEIVKKYKMKKGFDGGYSAVIYRSTKKIETDRGERDASAAMYNVLPAGVMVSFRRLKWDEVRTYHLGRPMKIVEIVDGKPEETIVGPNVARGHVQLKLIKSGTWWGSCFLSSVESGTMFVLIPFFLTC